MSERQRGDGAAAGLELHPTCSGATVVLEFDGRVAISLYATDIKDRSDGGRPLTEYEYAECRKNIIAWLDDWYAPTDEEIQTTPD